MKTFLSFLVVLFIVAAQLSAQTVWKADPVHSRVNFSVTHLVISEVTGRFKDFDVTITQPTDDFTGATVNATIKTASISTDNERRDKHLQSDDFLNVEKFPDMIFKSSGIEKTGDNTYKIKGNLTMRDVTKPVVLDAKMTGQVTAWGGKMMGFKATTTIDRFEFGTKFNKTIETGGLLVGKNVDITLLMELSEKKPDAEKKN